MANTCYIPKNLGGRTCGAGFVREATAFLFVPEGSNEVTFATIAAMTADAVTTAINATDPSKRAIPINDIENYEPTQGDAQVQEYKSQRKAFIAAGVVNQKGVMASGDPVLQQNYTSLNNGAWRVFIVGTNGFNYEVDSATKLIVRGLKVSKGSFTSKQMPSDGATNVEQLEIGFDIDKDTDWSLFRFTSYDDLGHNLNEVVNPLIPIDSVVVSDEAITGFTLVIKDERGNPISGLETADITVTNITDPGVEAGTLSESSTGTYGFVYTTPVTASDVLAAVISADGFDSYGVTIDIVTPA